MMIGKLNVLTINHDTLGKVVEVTMPIETTDIVEHDLEVADIETIKLRLKPKTVALLAAHFKLLSDIEDTNE